MVRIDIYSYAVAKSHIAYVSMQRIEDFLREEEVDDWACSLSAPIKNQHNDNVKEHPLTVGFSNAVFRWPGMRSTTDTAPSLFQLGPLNDTFPPGGLSIVTGPTGSGKSAFLAALLGGLFFRHSFMPFSDVERDQKWNVFPGIL
jgi:ABC-type siderophore export system fused ATPase/permease subunit